METYPVLPSGVASEVPHHEHEVHCMTGDAVVTTGADDYSYPTGKSNVKESIMSHEGVSDKVDVQNIFKPGHGSGGMEGGLASALPLLLAGRADHGGFGGAGGFGAGLVGGILGGALFGGRRGGLFGGGDNDNGSGGAESRIQNNADTLAILNAVNAGTAATNFGTAKVTSDIQTQTFQIAQGLTNVNNSVVASASDLGRAIALVNQNVSEQGCETRAAIAASTTAILSRIDRSEIDELRHERDRSERNVEIQSLRSNIEINNTATATQMQNQSQFQVQSKFQDLDCKFNRLFDLVQVVHQEARATNSNVIAGNTAAVTTGVQTASPTNIGANTL
jgi:hypothetical protein